MRRRVVANVTGEALKAAIREDVDSGARIVIVTDENSAYSGIGLEYAGGHESVCHSARQYARGDVHTNTAESSFALVKRGIMGIYHKVSRQHLHRYLWQFDFMWNHRKLNDGERTTLAIQGAEGKRLLYRGPTDSVIC
ncbi:MAG: IS1595 family transposase [Terriglobales bacterium]